MFFVVFISYFCCSFLKSYTLSYSELWTKCNTFNVFGCLSWCRFMFFFFVHHLIEMLRRGPCEWRSRLRADYPSNMLNLPSLWPNVHTKRALVTPALPAAPSDIIKPSDRCPPQPSLIDHGQWRRSVFCICTFEWLMKCKKTTARMHGRSSRTIESFTFQKEIIMCIPNSTALTWP